MEKWKNVSSYLISQVLRPHTLESAVSYFEQQNILRIHHWNINLWKNTTWLQVWVCNSGWSPCR